MSDNDTTIETREDAIKVLHDLKAEQKRLADRGDALETQLEQKAADLVAVQKALAESQAPRVEAVSEKEATLRTHIREDGTLDIEGLINDPTDRGEGHAEFKSLVDDRNFCRMLTKSGKGAPIADAKLAAHMKSAPGIIALVFSDASGVGEDFIPDVLLPVLGRKLYTPSVLEAALPSMDVTSKELRIPFSSAAVAPYLKSSATWSSITATDSTTSQISATCKSFGARITADEDTVADASMVAGLDYLREEIATALRDAIEDAIINGNTDTTHGDINTVASPRLWDGDGRWNTATVASTAADHRRAFIGWRGASGDKSTDRNASAMTYADILATRAMLGSGYQAAGDLLMVGSPTVLVKHLLALAECKTLDVFGSAAAILTGSIGKLGGMDVVVSGFMTSDLNASGVFDGVTETKTGYVIAHRPSWRMANYKSLTTDIDREITSGTIEIVGTRRSTLIDMSGTNKSVAFGYNVTA